MLWLILAFLGALSQSTNNLCSKKSLARLDEYVVAFARSLFASLCLLPVLFFIGIPELTAIFWVILFVVSGLSAVATVLLMRAIKLSPLSLTIPLL